MATKRKSSQNEKILNYLQKGNKLTVKWATTRYGVTKLSARIHELRSRGFKIYTRKNKKNTTFYSMNRT